MLLPGKRYAATKVGDDIGCAATKVEKDLATLVKRRRGVKTGLAYPIVLCARYEMTGTNIAFQEGSLGSEGGCA